MKRILLLILLSISTLYAISQTIVKMAMPQQSLLALNVVKLFDESLPVKTTVVLGAIGFEITGGTSPYVLNWMENDKILSTGDIAVITPEVGKSYTLKVLDKNNCSSVISLNLDASAKAKSQSLEYISTGIVVSPTLVSNQINIGFLDNGMHDARVRIYDYEGKLQLDKVISGNTVLPISLPQANYIVLVESDSKYYSVKITVH